jgi:hypothetical protein
MIAGIVIGSLVLVAAITYALWRHNQTKAASATGGAHAVASSVVTATSAVVHATDVTPQVVAAKWVDDGTPQVELAAQPVVVAAKWDD